MARLLFLRRAEALLDHVGLLCDLGIYAGLLALGYALARWLLFPNPPLVLALMFGVAEVSGLVAWREFAKRRP